MKVKLIMLFIFLFGFVQQTNAGKISYFCIGEHENECDTKPVYPCENNAEAIAKGICTLRTSNGPVAQDYYLDPISIKDGNKCGYRAFKVECVSKK